MTNEPVVGAEVSLSEATVDQLLESRANGSRGNSISVGAHDAYAHGLVVVTRCVCAHTAPAPALVGTSISTDAPVVADVRPSVGVHVEVLHVAHLSGTSCLSGAGSSRGMMDHEEWRWTDREDGRRGSTCSPFSAMHSGWAA